MEKGKGNRHTITFISPIQALANEISSCMAVCIFNRTKRIANQI